MNEEIKEILEIFKQVDLEDDVCCYNCPRKDKDKTCVGCLNNAKDKILDYITNLQEERDMYKGSFETMSKNYFEEKAKNDKVIEFINENNFHYMNEYALKRFRNDLLNILRGDKK